MSHVLILTPQGRHSLQKSEYVCKVGRGEGGAGEVSGAWGGGGWRGVASATGKCIGESFLGGELGKH